MGILSQKKEFQRIITKIKQKGEILRNKKEKDESKDERKIDRMDK